MISQKQCLLWEDGGWSNKKLIIIEAILKKLRDNFTFLPTIRYAESV
jgi:hypothetical protein